MVKRILIFGLSCLVILSGLILARYRTTAADDRWQIRGALSEACTCSVPCTCNFGQGPSPHNYCHVVYAYGIREGNFNSIKLDGLKIGAMETAKGNAMYLDDSASPDQRKALETIARQMMRVTNDRMGGAEFLGLKWVQIKQEYNDRQDLLELGSYGGFKTNYLMGRDKTKPITVVNNSEWAIHEAIKGKTEYLRVKDEYGNEYSVKDTNSNHGDFEYTEKSHPGRGWPASSCSVKSKESEQKHKH
jgi:Protein of unknown function (DUF1326)